MMRRAGESRVFATVPEPGHAEGIVIDGDTVFIGTTGDAVAFSTGAKTPSVIFAFDRASGQLRYTLHVEGEQLDPDAPLNGISGLALDAAGRLYAADIQGRILRFDLGRRERPQEVYATIPDLPSCEHPGAGSGCSPTLDDRTPLPNGIVFDASGDLYVTDSWQATIFRVPAGGGQAQVWFQSERIDGFFGANGIRVGPGGDAMYLAVTRDRTETSWIFRLPFVAAPNPRDLVPVATWPPRARPVAPAGADGIAFSTSGVLYVVLGGDEEVAALDVTTGARQHFASPLLHNPASLAFDNANGRLLVTNHAFYETDPAHWTIVDLPIEDRGLPLPRPSIP
jgi:DNA-binding beta-propeller fold protein YncE